MRRRANGPSEPGRPPHRPGHKKAGRGYRQLVSAPCFRGCGCQTFRGGGSVPCVIGIVVRRTAAPGVGSVNEVFRHGLVILLRE